MQNLLDVMRRLRGPGGCPWDQKQTHESLRPYLLEEAAEAVDAIGSGDAEGMADELGDVLLQVAFHAVIAEGSGAFDYDDIERSIVDKLIRRHPHVFGEVEVDGAEQVVTNWQAIKAAEKAGRAGGETPPAERVPRSLPALMRAFELGKELEWQEGGPDTIRQALESDGGLDGQIGALLLAVVDYARALGVNPELALREAADSRAARNTGE